MHLEELSLFKFSSISMETEEKKKTTPLTWIVTIVLFCLFFYIAYSLFSGETPFESKSSKCKREAQERARTLRDAEIEGLKLKASPTEADKQELERLEIQKKTKILDRDDYEYMYNECMK